MRGRLVRAVLLAAVVVLGVTARPAPVSAADAQVVPPPSPKPLDVVRSPEDVAPGGGSAIVVRVDRIELRRGPDLVRQFRFDGRNTTLAAVVDAVADRDWAARDGSVVTLRTALAQGPMTTMRVAAPAITELRLVSNRNVFVGGTEAVARFEGVRVTSWRTLAAAAPDEDPDDTAERRPFLLYQDGSRLDVVDSEMLHLGSDLPYRSGVTWRKGGTRGEVVRSRFAWSYAGLTAVGAGPLVVRDSRFQGNATTGLELRGDTRGAVVEGSRSWANGGDGFVLAAGVTQATVQASRAEENGGAGVVVNGSSRNLLAENEIVGNGADGIVVRRAAHTVVSHNQLRGHRVGVRVAEGGDRTRLHGNRIATGQVGIELHPSSRDTEVLDGEVADAARSGMVLDGEGATVVGGEVRGSPVAVDVRGSVRLRRLAVSRSDRGAVVRRGATLDADDIEIDAERVAVDLAPAAIARVRNSLLDGRRPIDGGELTVSQGNVIPPPPFPWLATVGVALIVLAVGLDLLRRFRERRDPHPELPPGVWNTT